MWDRFRASGVSHSPCHAGKLGRQQPGLLSCPSKPGQGRATSLALPLPGWQSPAAPVSVLCWALGTPEPCPSCQQIPACLPNCQPYSDITCRHWEILLPCVPMVQPRLCSVHVHGKSSTHSQASTSRLWGRSLQSSAPMGQSQLSWIKRVSVKLCLFSCKMHHFLQEMWECFSPQVNKKNPDSQDKS